MCTPGKLVSRLPKLPDDCWSSIEVTESENGLLEVRSSYEPLASVEPLWHDNLVDYFSLKPIRKLSARVREVNYLGRTAIAKIARFPWEIDNIANETLTYCMISDKQGDSCPESVTPTFLGHLHENGRVMGLLLDKTQGRHAGLGDINACKAAMRQLHTLGIEHGDLNKHSFIIDDSTQKAYVVDFEHATNLTQDTAQREFASIAQELAEDTGRGGMVIVA